MQDVYGELVAISTIVAVTVASIALIIRMGFAESAGWLTKPRLAQAHCYHLDRTDSLGFIVAYLQPLISGGQYMP